MVREWLGYILSFNIHLTTFIFFTSLADSIIVTDSLLGSVAISTMKDGTCLPVSLMQWVICIYIYICVHIYIHIHIHIHIHTYIHTCTYMHIHTYYIQGVEHWADYGCIHTDTYIHTHTYTYIIIIKLFL